MPPEPLAPPEPAEPLLSNLTLPLQLEHALTVASVTVQHVHLFMTFPGATTRIIAAATRREKSNRVLARGPDCPKWFGGPPTGSRSQTMPSAATSERPAMKSRMSDPGVQSIARVSWVRPVRYATKCRSRVTTYP